MERATEVLKSHSLLLSLRQLCFPLKQRLLRFCASSAAPPQSNLSRIMRLLLYPLEGDFAIRLHQSCRFGSILNRGGQKPLFVEKSLPLLVASDNML